jgi:hypothetical protein
MIEKYALKLQKFRQNLAKPRLLFFSLSVTRAHCTRELVAISMAALSSPHIGAGERLPKTANIGDLNEQDIDFVSSGLCRLRSDNGDSGADRGKFSGSEFSRRG